MYVHFIDYTYGGKHWQHPFYAKLSLFGFVLLCLFHRAVTQPDQWAQLPQIDLSYFSFTQQPVIKAQ